MSRFLFLTGLLLIVPMSVQPAHAQDFSEANVAAPENSDAAWGEPPSWGDLTAGPHAVGFRVIRTLDRSRGYWPLRDYRGEPNPAPTERPIQIGVWYPAAPGPSAEPMAFREYVELQATALGERHAEELRPFVYRELRGDQLGRYFPPDGPDDAQIEAVLAQPTAAYRDAPATTGSFPLVIHSGFGPFAQSVLLEYLASHGYVVVTTHMLGSSPAWFNRGSGTLEWWMETARDVAFLRSFAAGLENADPRRAAVIGMTAAAGLLDQMDSMHLSALAGIEASYPDRLLEAPGFEPARVRIPVLDVVSSGNTQTEAMLERLAFADRWLVRFDDVDHVAMYQFQRLVGAESALEHRGYAVTARVTRRFLDAHLKDEAGGSDERGWAEAARAEIPAGIARIEYRPGEPPIPTEHELLLLVRRGEMEEVERAYGEAASRGHPRFFDAGNLRTVGIFRLFDDDDPEGAAAAFRILVDAYPEDPQGWRWLGRSLHALGDRSAAREALKRALDLAATAEMSDEDRRGLLERIEMDLTRLDETTAP